MPLVVVVVHVARMMYETETREQRNEEEEDDATKTSRSVIQLGTGPVFFRGVLFLSIDGVGRFSSLTGYKH